MKRVQELSEISVLPEEPPRANPNPIAPTTTVAILSPWSSQNFFSPAPTFWKGDGSFFTREGFLRHRSSWSPLRSIFFDASPLRRPAICGAKTLLFCSSSTSCCSCLALRSSASARRSAQALLCCSCSALRSSASARRSAKALSCCSCSALRSSANFRRSSKALSCSCSIRRCFQLDSLRRRVVRLF